MKYVRLSITVMAICLIHLIIPSNALGEKVKDINIDTPPPKSTSVDKPVLDRPGTKLKPSTTASAKSTTTPSPNAEKPKPKKDAKTKVPPKKLVKPDPTQIRFQFDGLPYVQVIQRFSRISNKPLIGDLKIEGTLSYTDPEPYSYDQALDTLNIILATKGMILIESGRFLQLVPIKDVQKTGLKIFRGTDKTGDVRPGQIVTVVLPLKNLDPTETAKAVTPMLSAAGSVAPSTAGKSLIITDRLVNIKRIQNLITITDLKPDEPKPRQNRHLRTYTLVHSSGSVVSDLINGTFGIKTAPVRTKPNPKTGTAEPLPPHPDDYITSVYDAASRTLVLAGPEDRLKKAEELIKQFEREDRAGEVRIFYPRIIKVAALAGVIRQAIPGIATEGEVPAAGSAKARLIADTEQNRLIVSAPVASQLIAIEKLIQNVDTNKDGAKGRLRSEIINVTKVLTIKNANPANVAKVITQATTEINDRNETVVRTKVTVDESTSRIVVTGSPGDVQTAVDITTQMDTLTRPNTPRQTRIIDFDDADELKRIQPLLEKLYAEQIKGENTEKIDPAVFLPEPNSARLIVTATQVHLEKVEKILTQIRIKTKPITPRKLVIIQLKNTKTDEALTTITKLVAERKNDAGFKGVTEPLILPDEPNSRLLVTATDAQILIIEQIVKTVDIAPANTLQQMRVITLKTRTANDIIPLITKLLETEKTDNPNLKPPQLIADGTGKRLIVLANDVQYKRIQELTLQLDAAKPSGPKREFRAIELTNQDPAELAPLITKLYEEQLKGQADPEGGPASITVDDKRKRLIITGPAKEITRVETIFKQLAISKPVAKKQTLVIRLKSSKATDLASLVTKSLAANDKNDKVQVLADEPSNSLIVSGTAKAVQSAAAMITQLDVQPNRAPREIRIIDLKEADATTIAPTLTNLISQSMAAAAGPNYKVQSNIVADAKTNRLIISGPKDELEKISGIIEKLDQPTTKPDGAHVFQLKSGDATEIAAVVKKAMTTYDDKQNPIYKVNVEAEKTTNSVIVAGEPQQVAAAKLIIEQLDKVKPAAGRALRMVEVPKHARNTEVAALAMKVWRDQHQNLPQADSVSITAEPDGKRIIVVAPKELADKVTVVITSLIRKPRVGDSRKLHVIAIGNRKANEVIDTVKKIYQDQHKDDDAPQPTLLAGGKPGEILVMASKTQFESIKTIIATLGANTPPAKRETKVVEFEDGTELQRIINIVEQLYKKQFADLTAGGPADAVLIRDNQTGRLVVTGRAEHITFIEKAIEKLREPKVDNRPRVIRIIELDDAEEVTKLKPILEQLYKEQFKDGKGRDKPDATILSDPTNDRLIVTAKTTHLDIIDDLIAKIRKRKPIRPGRETRIIELGDADEVKRVLALAQQLYTDQLKHDKKAGPADATFLPDETNGRLIITARADHLKKIEAIIANLKPVIDKKAERQTRVYDLTAAQSETLANTVMQVYQEQIKDRKGAKPDRVLVLPDSASNRLIVVAPAAELARLDAIITQLDKVTKQTSGTRVFKLEFAKAAQVGTTLTQSMVTIDSRGNSIPRISVGVDTKSNTIVVSGDAKDLQAVQSVIESLDNPETKSKRTVKAIKIKGENITALVSKVKELFTSQTQDDEDAAGTVILPDEKASRVIVTADARHMAIVEQLLELMDVVEAKGIRETRIFEVGDETEVSRIQSLVQQLYKDELKDDKKAGLADAQILPDIPGGRLIVTARTEHLKRIEAILERLKVQNKVAPKRETRVYELKTAQATELAQTVQQLFNAKMKDQDKRLVDKTLILPDATANRLIVMGAKPALEAIETIVQKLDTVTLQAANTRIFRLKTSEASQVATILSNALVRVTSGGSRIPRVAVGADEKSNTLIVSGETKDIAAAATIIEQLDTLRAKQKRQMRIFKLEQGEAAAMATKVKTLYLEQMKGAKGDEPADALILGDEGSNRLIVTATNTQLDIIGKIIADLDKSGVSTVRQLRVFMLTNHSAAAVATVVSQLFSEQVNAARADKRVVVTAAPSDRAVVVDAPTAVLDRISDLVMILDAKKNQTAFEVRSYRLTQANATQIGPALARLFAQQSNANKSEPQPRFEADAVTNTLIIAATAAQFSKIDALIKQLQTSVVIDSQIRTFHLRHSDAQQTAKVLSSMLNGDGSAAGRPLVRVSAAPAVNSVVVHGAPNQLTLAEHLILAIDKPRSDQKVVIRTMKLKKAGAASLAAAVNKTLASRPDKRTAERVTVTAEANSNSLIIDGPETDVTEVIKIIESLDADSSGGGIDVRIFRLENGQAKEISDTLGTLMRGMIQREAAAGKSNGGFQLVPDSRTNSLIVTGRPSHFAVVEQLLAALDKAPRRSEKNAYYFWLDSARAGVVKAQLDAMFANRPEKERPIVEIDPSINTVTVVAMKQDLVAIDEMIRKIDESAADQAVQVRVLPVGALAAEEVAESIRRMYGDIRKRDVRVVDELPMNRKVVPDRKPNTDRKDPPDRKNVKPSNTKDDNQSGIKKTKRKYTPLIIAVDRSSNSLLLSGSPRDLEEIEKIILRLAKSARGDPTALRTYTLTKADAVSVAKLINDLFTKKPVLVPQPSGSPVAVTPPPDVTAVAEARSRTVIVRARVQDFVRVEELIKDLDGVDPSGELHFRLIRLQHAKPVAILPLVNQMVKQLQTVRPGESISVTADERTRGLVVVARKQMFDPVQTIIKQLDVKPEFAEAEVLVMPLEKANANQLSGILNAMLRPSVASQVTNEARVLQEQVRLMRIRNAKGKPVLLDLTKPIKIMADPQTSANGGGNRLILQSTPDNLKALESVVKMMDRVPVGAEADVRVVHLKHANATAAANTLSNVFQQGIKLATGPTGKAAPKNKSGRALTNPLNVAADIRTNSLVISGGKPTLELALRVIKDMDAEDKGFKTVVRLFNLQHASSERITPILQSVFISSKLTTPSTSGVEGWVRQVTRLQTALAKDNPKIAGVPAARAAVTIQADNTTNTVVIAAREDLMPLISDVVKSMDVKAADGMGAMRVFPMAHADATEIQKVLSELYTGPNAERLRKADMPTVTIDNRTNALVVVGNNKAMDVVQGLIQKLDKDVPIELRDIRILPIQNADALTVGTMIQKMIDARVKRLAAIGPRKAEGLRVLIVGDARTNSLLIGGSKDGYELVAGLAKQLDRAGPALSGQIRILILKHANAGTLAPTLTNLFDKRYAAAATADVARRKPIIAADLRTNTLLIAAGVEDNKVIENLVQRLDSKTANPSVQLTVIGLLHNDASLVTSMLNRVFTARLTSTTPPNQPPAPQARVNVEADAQTNSLIVSASADNLKLIKGLLQKIDVKPIVKGSMFELFALKHAEAGRAAAMLKSLVDQGIYRPGVSSKAAATTEKMAIAVDTRTNTIIVSASPTNLAVVKEVIARIDAADYAKSGTIRTYPLKHASAIKLANSLEQFFRSKRTIAATATKSPGETPVVITADERTNTLIVAGGKESFVVLDQMIKELDVADVVAKAQYEVFIIKHSTATKLAGTLKQLFAQRPRPSGGDVPQPITIVPDPLANMLVIGATAEDLKSVAKLIQRLDAKEVAKDSQVLVLSLRKADATKVAATVTGLYGEGGGAATGQTAVVNVDTRTNSLIITAGKADAQRITKLVKQLDTAHVARVSELRVFQLQHARAEDLAKLLTDTLNAKAPATAGAPADRQTLLQFITTNKDGTELIASALKEGVLISADARTNSLVVTAPVDNMPLLKQIVLKFDKSLPQHAKIKVFALKNADARQMVDVLRSLFRLTNTGGSNQERAVRYQLERPKTKVSTNGPKPKGTTKSDSATVGSAEETALTVTLDMRTNSLLVGGTEHYLKLVEEIITELDSSPAQERESKIYRLKNARAVDVERAIRQFLDQDRQRIATILGQDAVGTAQRMLDREVAIVAEPESNTLLLSASPRFFEHIAELITEIDQPQPQVLIQVLLAEVTLDDETDLGFEWKYTDMVNGKLVNAGTDFGIDSAASTLGGFSASVTGGDLEFILRALKSSGKLEVLSRPQILAADNKEATIDIGQRVPLVNASRVTEQGDTINTFSYENVGVSLVVTPRINPESMVVLEVAPTVSSLSSSNVDISPGVQAPIINQRVATTTVSVQSGQTIIIGGLISTTDDAREQKVPLVGDLPYLGGLFRSTTVRSTRTELLIFLTPQVLQAPADAKKVTSENLNQSEIKGRLNRDAVQKKLLDLFFQDKKLLNPGGRGPLKPTELKNNN